MIKPLHEAQDHELVRVFIEGNEAAFNLLLHRHKSKVFTTIYMIVKDRMIAEDLFQDVMIKVVKMIRAGKYNEEGKFRPWVARIARNLAIDHFRKNQRTPVQHESDDYKIFNNLNTSEPNVEQRIIKDENARFIRELVHQLPDKQKEVLIMRHYGDLSFKEIAKLTDVSINTALGRMRYALINLRKMVAERDNQGVYGRQIRQE